MTAAAAAGESADERRDLCAVLPCCATIGSQNQQGRFDRNFGYVYNNMYELEMLVNCFSSVIDNMSHVVCM